MEEVNEIVCHDTATDMKCRVYASISFAVLLLGIGIPLWWHTTAVPRVALPYSGIEDLSNLEIRVKSRIIVASMSRSRAESLAEQIRTAFNQTEIYKLDVVHQAISSNLLAAAFTLHQLEGVASTFDLEVGDLLLLEATNLQDEVLAGSRRTLFFSLDTSGSKLIEVLSRWIIRDRSLALTKNALTEPTAYSLDFENRRRFPASPAYDVLITMVNPEPEKVRVDWDLRTIAEEYVKPFLNGFSVLSNFSVKSQWLYLVTLDISPKRVPDSSTLGRHYALPEDVLPQLVTPLEKKLGSQVSLYPCINFVVYVVPCDNAPLHIYTRNGYRLKGGGNVEAFLSPRWGGVVLHNPPVEVCENAMDNGPVTVVPEETAIVGTFLEQLRLLLGIPELKPIEGVNLFPLLELKSRDWEIDTLLRIRTVEQLTSAKLTLQSLAQLLKEISNIVITDVVGNRIKTALSLVKDSAERLERGDLTNAFIFSKEAFVTAEAAFSDPTLLALLYFPEDQKYAVYIPLFLPAIIPVLLSLKNIRRYYFPEKSKKENKTEDDSKLKAE